MRGAYVFRQWAVPAPMVEVLADYIENGVPTGRFLMSVLSNQLAEAAMTADDINMANLPAYAAFLVNVAPSECWGSPAKVAAWLAQHAAARATRIP